MSVDTDKSAPAANSPGASEPAGHACWGDGSGVPGATHGRFNVSLDINYCICLGKKKFKMNGL